ncbi:hypothetical protein C8A01DRAFT_44964 [Parachaetomium inaequale]|uniref:Uncharacterized protein n=1 Tax=Parachaetomium inaequale TaxID=2588326 RepID=A0AAN6PNA9_9PEZI|nr:hypothetical protein C8A01DRAFT_44964 [Parachaetomium inaequale]
MPAPSKLSSHARRRGLGDCPSKPAVKPGYCPDIHLTDDHPCAPPLPPQIFSSSNTELWPATPGEHHDFFPAWERPPKQQHQRLTPPASHTTQGTSHAELTRLSTREYALRAADPSDFASAWENSIMPLLSDLLQKHCTGDFAVDVHNFPEMSSEAVPRVIYITLSTDGDTTTLEQTVRAELARAVPEQFNPVYLKFRKGGLRRSTSTWWGQQDAGEEDAVCAPKNVTYKPTPVIGMSIGPSQIPDAASLGGFVRVGSELYAMSAYHAFEDSIHAAQLQVSHPADPDFPLIVPADPLARQYSIGSVATYSPLGTFRPSLTFQGRGFAEEKTRVELDYCLIGPVPKGRNLVSVPCLEDMGRCVAVEGTATVEGNTEVYAMARTSGYSLGFTSDVPGLQKISGHLRREWTVRQYSPSSRNPTDGRADAPWQTLKQWVTSGIGVPGDSGAWLIRRSDNAVVGLIWGRNYNTGDPAERIRLTYFTPIVDILADVKQKYAGEQEVVLPVYQPQDLSRSAQARSPLETVAVDMSQEPWSAYAQDAIRERRQVQASLIRSRFVGAHVPASGAVLDRQTRDEDPVPSNDHPSTHVSNLEPMESSLVDPPTTPPRSEGGGSISTLRSREKLLLGLELNSAPNSAPDSAPDLSSLPELSNASSIPSGSSVEGSNFDVAPDGVRIVGEELDGDEDIIEVIEAPIRTKASFSSRHPGLLRLDQLLI